VPVQFAARVSVPLVQLGARHCWVFGKKPSCGHVSFTPSQLSVASHTPFAARQTAVLFASAGHAPFTPSQKSATSHTPAAGRHTAVLLTFAGQLVELPVHVSAGSQTPVDARHVAPAFPAGC